MRRIKVIMIGAMTLCGRISPAPLGSPVDRGFLEAMRDATDASLMGGNTLRHGDPEMRGAGGRQGSRMRALITMSGNIPVEGKKIFSQGTRPFVFCSEEQSEGLARRLAHRAEVIALPVRNDRLSIAAAIYELESRGARSVLVEGGAMLNYWALREKMVDEIMVTITPQLSGEKNAPTLTDGPVPLGRPFLALTLLSCRPEANGELYTHYRVSYEENHA